MANEGDYSRESCERFVPKLLPPGFPLGRTFRHRLLVRETRLNRAHSDSESACCSSVPQAETAHRDFLTLWEDADSDVPILKQAQAEYAKL